MSSGDDLLTEKQRARLIALFTVEEHVEVEATWSTFQRMIAAYRDHDRDRGGAAMTALIDAVATGVPAELVELRRLGRTLMERSAEVLAYFNRQHTSNGPSEAICESGFGWSGTGWSGSMSVVSAWV